MNYYGFKGALIPNLLSELYKNQYIDVYRLRVIKLSSNFPNYHQPKTDHRIEEMFGNLINFLINMRRYFFITKLIKIATR